MKNQASIMWNHASYRKQSKAYHRCKEKAGHTGQNRAGRTMRHNARHGLRRHDMARQARAVSLTEEYSDDNDNCDDALISS
jgi:hypothetical protein